MGLTRDYLLVEDFGSSIPKSALSSAFWFKTHIRHREKKWNHKLSVRHEKSLAVVVSAVGIVSGVATVIVSMVNLFMAK